MKCGSQEFQRVKSVSVSRSMIPSHGAFSMVINEIYE